MRCIISPSFKIWVITCFVNTANPQKSQERQQIISTCLSNTDWWAGSHFIPNWIYSVSSTGKTSKKQSIIQHKKLWQTTTMSFVSEPVCMPHCPAVETWFQGSESLLRISFSTGTRARRGQQRDGMKRPSVTPDAETTCVSSLSVPAFISGFINVCLSYSLCLFC